ncbi:efflux RND transporter periplasmic adaptor subunit [Brevibacillus brevis]|uniref:efflux RND transporter periplasmic adaptor subunit n=1 Tax=Brevibacillus brevis TaxID=1393 RepID=UPI000D1133B9|nr:efflux RND transporter periplasmic adaptor subunit [Brevibacillus brevis]PSJ68159.1 efflux RND transporter periplasmic adaptor subunit [Brevibacillus brevis]RED35649.1 RND family efflux transporter MFP subunit [Brevibacillus brevis]GEC87675.1 RND transporter [Brevibacillus brevis]VEF89240.1 Efflux pump periplasmic linker BepF [Brevibacillus brevis]
MKKTKLISSGVACLIGLTIISGCNSQSAEKTNSNEGRTPIESQSSTEIETIKVENSVDVQVEEVTEGELKESDRLLAEVFANTDVSIYGKTTGTVSEILVKKGDTVKKGQVIGKLDQTEAQLKLRHAEAALAVANANLEHSNKMGTSSELANSQLKQAEQTYASAQRTIAQGLTLAQANYDRAKKLFEEKALSKSELENAENAYLQAKNQYQSQLDQAQTALINARTQVNTADKNGRVTQANVQQGKVEVDISRNALENTLIKSTIDGIVTDIQVQEGDTINPQKPIATVINLDPMIVKVNVSEKALASFQKGTQLDLQVPSQNIKVKGSISYVGLKASDQSKLFPVEIEVPNPKGTLLPGMKAEVSSKKGQAGILIPTDAILERNGKSVAYVVDGERVAEKEISIASKGTEKTLIGSGVKPGDQVVIKGQSQLKDGAKIRIVP